MPARIQMSRQRRWRNEHPAAVIVARPTPWGNPWRVVRRAGGFSVVTPTGLLTADRGLPRAEACRMAVVLFRKFTVGALDLAPLAGRDLACWCAVGAVAGDRPWCHADVLLALANPAQQPRVS